MTGPLRQSRRAACSRARSGSGRCAFTLIDVLVTMGVVAILIGILLPGMGKVRELSRQIVCRSNLRQIGLGLALYADGSRDQLPHSVFLDPPQQNNGLQRAPQDMMTLRLRSSVGGNPEDAWDGLGRLYSSEVLPSQQIFYCPSHHGRNGFDRYEEAWRTERSALVGNFHFRGEGPNKGVRYLSFIEPSRSALAADGMRSLDDYNHLVGLNVLRADLSLFWLSDSLGMIGQYIAENSTKGFDSTSFDMLWDQLDAPDNEVIGPHGGL